MPRDVIKEIRVEGLRTVVNVHLRLSPLTVLTGTIGSGKSTIIEACEILRSASQPGFLENFIRVHGGLDAFRSAGAQQVHLGVRIEGQDETLNYDLSIGDLEGLAILEEELQLERPERENITVLRRSGPVGIVLSESDNTQIEIRPIPGRALLLSGLGLRIPHSAIRRTIQALAQIEVHLPFAIMPQWVERLTGFASPSSMRASPINLPGDSLSRLGLNLANVYQTLKEDKNRWESTLEYVRLGLGDDIEDVLVKKTTRGDKLEIWLKYRSFEPLVPAQSLSDGTLGYLAFVAIFRLSSKRSLIAFDEPETQLHPNMASRVAQFFESMACDQTILVATHSDRFLDSLRDPAKSVVLCSLGPNRETRIFRPDADALRRWLEDYRGIGDLRSAGHESSVMTRLDGPK